MAILKACPHCRALMPQGLLYCPSCAPIMEARREEIRAHNKAQKDRAYNRRRDPRYLAFYRSKEWRATSRAILSSAGYKCAARLPGCSGLAVEVHHIKPIQTEEGWAERLEAGNLEPLCTSCHNARHKRGQSAAPAGVVDLRAVQR